MHTYRMVAKQTWALLLAVAAAVLLVATATTVAGAVSGGVGGRPANPDPKNPRSESIFIYTVKQGQTKTDAVLVSNNSDETHTIKLYPVDGVVTNTGAYTCKQRVESRQGVGAWLQLDRDEVTLAPGKSTEVDFRLAMPGNADVGEHNGCIVFETKADDDQQASGNVRIRTRQAIRVLATVPGDLHRQVAVQSLTSGRIEAKRLYSLSLKNVGNVSADVDVRVSVKGMFGGELYINGGQYPVLANQKLELDFQDDSTPFWGGWYTLHGEIAYNKAAGSLGIAANESDLQTAKAEPVTVFIAPSPLATMLFIALLAAAVGALGWCVAKARQKATRHKTWVSYTVQPGDTIESVASAHKLKWQKLAEANSLKAPYTLKKNATLKVPPATKKQRTKRSKKGHEAA